MNTRRPPRWVGWASIVILCLGSLQFVGYLLKIPSLRGIGSAIGFAPYTKVFSDVDGFETFAASFEIRYRIPTETGDELVSLQVDPAFYQQLSGPYNRRNVYGAALSYAPRLPEDLWTAVFCYGFNGPLRNEFQIPENASDFEIIIRSNTKGRHDVWEFAPQCLD